MAKKISVTIFLHFKSNMILSALLRGRSRALDWWRSERPSSNSFSHYCVITIIESQNASTKGWAALKFLVMLKRKSIEAVSLPSVSESGFEGELIKDDQSSTLYPFDAPKGLTPVKVYGDGNCFYRSISLSLFGCENHHVEMRVRTLFELVHNKIGIQTLKF